MAVKSDKANRCSSLLLKHATVVAPAVSRDPKDARSRNCDAIVLKAVVMCSSRGLIRAMITVSSTDWKMALFSSSKAVMLGRTALLRNEVIL